MNALNETRIKMLAVDCLRSLKERKTFRALSKDLDLPAGVLNRYVNGYVLPKYDRAELIIDNFTGNQFRKLLSDLSQRPDSKYVVTADILTQPFLLNLIGYHVSKYHKGVRKVFTSAVDGIPVAIKAAEYLNARCIYAKQTQEISFSDHFISKPSKNKPLGSPFYLPKNQLRKNDTVVIVDDVIRGGATFDALLSICTQARATISGVFAIFITKSAYRSIKKEFEAHYLFLVDG